jgi:ubiquinone/menaquinone biosynthesis C-methylase UbiE
MNEERAYWDGIAKRYDRTMLLLGGPLPAAIARVAAKTRGAKQVLEVAAGTGLFTTAIAAGAEAVVSTDHSPAMVAALKERLRREGVANVRAEPADLFALPFAVGTFDVVVAANVLHLVDDLAGALAALRRMLRPGGTLVVPTFCHDETAVARITSRLLAVASFPGRRRFSVASLAQAVAAAGFEVTATERLPGLLPIGYVEGVPHAAS